MLRPPRLVVLLALVSGCAGDLVNHRFDMPVSHAKRIDVRDAAGILVESVTDPASIQAFDASADRIDRWFDDVFGGPTVPEYTTEFFGDREWLGTLTIFPRRVHFVPGKGSAGITSREHDELLRILGINGPAPASPAAQARLISASGIGPVRLGMTLEQVRRAMPAGTVTRTSDGDGAALVEVTLAPDASLIVWADEDDPHAPIDWSKKIVTIETFSAAFRTSDGIHPGSLVVDVEKVYGKTQNIEKSEIESREYITFEKQPAHLTFRIDYTGSFPAGARETTQFKPGAKIHSIAVSRR